MNDPYQVPIGAGSAPPEQVSAVVSPQVDPRVKIVAVLCASTLAVTLDRWPSLVVLAGLCALPLFLSPVPRDQKRSLAGLLLLATWGTVLSQGIFYEAVPRTALVTLIDEGNLWGWHFSGLSIYLQGLEHGLIQSLRFNALILLGTSVCLTTSPERLFLGLTRLKVPYGLSFMAVTAVRFLPLVLGELRTVLAVRRLRGYRRFHRGLRRTLQTEVAVLKPVIVRALRKATDLAISLSLRAFDPTAGRTAYRVLTLSRRDRVGLALMTGITGIVVTLKGVFLLYVLEIFYSPSLRGLYGWIRTWL